MRTAVLIFLVFIFSFSFSKNGGLNVIEIPYNSSDITIDGDLSEWKQYFTCYFLDTSSAMHNIPGHELMAFYDDSYDYAHVFKPLSRNSVEARICWNMSSLSFGFIVSDRHLWAQNKLGGKYPNLHLNDGIEIYIDSKNDSGNKMDIHDYQFMIDVSGLNLVFRGDRELLASDTMAAPKKSGQNVFFKYKSEFHGTLNDTILDKGYTVEVMIPFAAIGLTAETGMNLRLELCNNDNDYNLDGVDSYEGKALRYWPFNWLGYSDFGYPETWIKAELVGKPAWFDTLSGSEMRQWFRFYIIVLIVTIATITLLMMRMKRMKRLPIRNEMKPSKVIFIEKHQIETLPELSDNEKILKKASAFLTDFHQENIGSEKLARHLGISIRKLQRITREELDATPTNFIYLVKLNLAAGFLKSRKGNVSETAYEFGFSDPAYFSKLFKKHFGMSPLEYMEKNDINQEN